MSGIVSIASSVEMYSRQLKICTKKQTHSQVQYNIVFGYIVISCKILVGITAQ